MLINATNNKVFFESAGGTFKIASNSKFSKSMNYSDQILKSSAQSDYNFSGDLNATLFNFINLNGNIYFIKDDKGNFEGSLSGIAYIDFDEHFDLLNFESIGTTADLDISIKARALIETSFSDEGLGEAEFGCYLGLNATGNVNLKDESITFGGDFEAWGNISLYKEYGEVNAGMEIMLKYYRASKNKEKSYSFSKDFNYKIY